MIAEIYPFLRLPRRFSYFDYVVPNSLKGEVGDVVLIPFRGREVPGVISSLKESSKEQKLATVISSLSPSWCSKEDIKRIEEIAHFLAQSPASIFHAISRLRPDNQTPLFLGKGKELSVSKKDVERVKQIIADIGSRESATIFGDKEIGIILTHALRKKTAGQMLVLLPRERDAEFLARSQNFGEQTALLHGQTSDKEKSRVICAWRNGKIRTLIATRIGSLIPAKKIELILVLDAGCEDHQNLRRNPRYDAREAAKILARQHGAKLLFLDHLPRLEELTTNDQSLPTQNLQPRTIDLRNRLENTGDPLITETLLEEIKKALQSQKKVLLFLNRKGVAKRLQCGACGHIPLCGTCGNLPSVRLDDLVCDRCGTEMWIPKNCPACGKPKINLRGIGGAKIASLLKEKFPEANVGRIEKGAVENPGAHILIATEFFFSSYQNPFSEKQFGLIADLAADIHLSSGDFRSAETAARKIARLTAFAEREGATCILQTWLPDAIQPMVNLQEFIKTELSLRKEYHLPPFRSRVTLSGAKLEDLHPDLQPLFVPHGEILELRPSTGQARPASYSTILPDKIKLLYDGPYVNNDRTPQSE